MFFLRKHDSRIGYRVSSIEHKNLRKSEYGNMKSL